MTISDVVTHPCPRCRKPTDHVTRVRYGSPSLMRPGLQPKARVVVVCMHCAHESDAPERLESEEER